MSGGLAIDVKVDLDRLEDRFSAASLIRAQELYARKASDLMKPFVPKKDHYLYATVDLASAFAQGILTWATPYAKYQYELVSPNRTAPGTDGHWDELLMKSSKVRALKAYAAALLEGKA